jgi:hypothetical protein
VANWHYQRRELSCWARQHARCVAQLRHRHRQVICIHLLRRGARLHQPEPVRRSGQRVAVQQHPPVVLAVLAGAQRNCILPRELGGVVELGGAAPKEVDANYLKKLVDDNTKEDAGNLIVFN